MNTTHTRIRRNWRAITAASAAIVDGTIVAASFLLALAIEYPEKDFWNNFFSHSNLFLFSVALYPVCYAGAGLYRIIAHATIRRHFLAAARGQLYAAVIILASLFIARNLFYSIEFLAAFFAMNAAVYLVAWTLLRFVQGRLRTAGYGRWNTIVVDGQTPMHRLVDRWRKLPELGYNVVSIVRSFPSENGGSRFHSFGEWLEHHVIEHKADLIAFSSSLMLSKVFEEVEQFCRKHDVRIRVYSEESDDLLRRTNMRDMAGLPIYSPERRRIEKIKHVVKRAADIVASGLLLALLSPLLLVAALLIKLESGGPVFFRQRRTCCENAETFLFYKFRTMVNNADEQKATLFSQNEADGALFKIKDDPRRTKVGRILRRYSLDELPQLINVFKGEMSLVGPRPLPVEDFGRLKEQDKLDGYYQLRSKMKPGMTGLWQVSGRSDLGFHEMILLDLYYIEHQTLLFDLEILTQTIPVVVFGKGAY